MQVPQVFSLKRYCIEALLAAYAQVFAPNVQTLGPRPKRIFILRNNDRGDLLTTTPLFEALKKAFPETQMIVGTGSWNLPLLEHNPYVHTVLPLDAPWHNKALVKPGRGQVQTFLKGLWYSLRSPQVRQLRALRADVGIDILGSPQGAFLLMQANIPYRLGVKGYAGGHRACQACLEFDPAIHVSTFALKFLELLGKENPGIAPRPQLYLTASESRAAEYRWQGYEQGKRKKGRQSLRIVLAPGGSFPDKCWPLSSFQALLERIETELAATVILTGSIEEKALGRALKASCPWIQDRMGIDSLRAALALAAGADCIVCNSSLMMHVGAAFQKKTLVLLGHAFQDAMGHERLWSYPATHVVLGKADALSPLPTPEQAWEALRALLKQ